MLFFIHFESRWVAIAGITVHPNEAWMKQMARNVTMDEHGVLLDCHYLPHDRDTKIARSFRTIFASGQMLFPRVPRRASALPRVFGWAAPLLSSTGRVMADGRSNILYFGQTGKLPLESARNAGSRPRR